VIFVPTTTFLSLCLNLALHFIFLRGSEMCIRSLVKKNWYCKMHAYFYIIASRVARMHALTHSHTGCIQKFPD